MKNLKLLALLALLASSSTVHAGVNCGSKYSGFKITGTTGKFAVNSGRALTLNDGMIRTTSAHATSVTGTVTGSNARLEIDDTADDRTTELSFDGSYDLGAGSLALGANQTLKMESGTTESTVTTTGTTADPSVIQGSGDFGGVITVATGQLNVDLQSTLNVNITNNGTVKLLDDLHFEDGKYIDGGTVDCNNNRLVLGSANFTQSAITVADAAIDLNSKMTLGGDITLSSAGYVNGKGHNIDFNDNAIDMNSNDLTIIDTTLSNFKTTSIANSANNDLYLSNVIFAHQSDNIGAVCVKGVGAPGSGSNALAKVTLAADSSFFDTSSVTFDNEVSLDIIKPVDLNTTWAFTTDAYINGQGHTLDLAGGVLDLGGTTNKVYISNAKLVGMVAGSMTNFGDIYLNKTTVQGSAGDMTINGNSASNNGYARVNLSDASFFAGNATFDNGANIQLHNNTTLSSSAVWTFNADTVLNGNGNVLDITNGRFVINSGATLYLKNVMIKGWTGSTASAGDGQIHFVDATTSVLDTTDTTIHLGGDVTFSQGRMNVYGPTTVVTGENKLTFSSNGDLHVDGVTLWYDTLTSTPDENISPTTHDGSIVHFSNRASIKTIRSQITKLVYPNMVKPFLGRSQLLYPASTYDKNSGDDESESRNVGAMDVTFEVGNGTNTEYDDGTYSFDGNGRFFHFGNNDTTGSSTLMTLNAGTDVTLKHILLIDMKNDNVSLAAEDDSDPENVLAAAVLRFGDETTIRLDSSDTLSRTYIFGVDSADTMVLDLNGHTLDMGTGGIRLDAGTLTIKNGRLAGLTTATSFQGNADKTVLFKLENVDLVLKDDTTFDATKGKIQIDKECSINGKDGASFFFNASSTLPTDTQSLTISRDSELRVETGIELKIGTQQQAEENTNRQIQHLVLSTALSTLDGLGTAQGGSGTLNLHGGRLKASGDGELVVNQGRLIADHRASMDGGTAGIRIGSSSLLLTGAQTGYADPGKANDATANGINDLTIELEPGATINVEAGTVTYDNFGG